MGICSSCESTAVATAKLILDDGRLQEYPYPVKVSYVLQANPACFICNSDELDFGGAVSAVDDDDELQPGQLYFALPWSRLKRPLRAEEMAALAVKASSALAKTGCCSQNIIVFPGDGGGNAGESGSGRRRSGGGRRRGKKSAAQLSSIPE